MYKVLVVGDSKVNGQGRPHFSSETVPTLEAAAQSLKVSRFDVVAVEDGIDLSRLGELPVQLVSLVVVVGQVDPSLRKRTQVVVLEDGPFVDELVRVIRHEISEKVDKIQTTALDIQTLMNARLATL